MHTTCYVATWPRRAYCEKSKQNHSCFLLKQLAFLCTACLTFHICILKIGLHSLLLLLIIFSFILQHFQTCVRLFWSYPPTPTPSSPTFPQEHPFAASTPSFTIIYLLIFLLNLFNQLSPVSDTYVYTWELVIHWRMGSLPVMMSPKKQFCSSTSHQLRTSSSARGGASEAPPPSMLEFLSLHLVRMLCRVYVWAPLTCLLPSEIRREHHSLWTEVMGGYKPLCGCWELVLGPLQEKEVF